MSSMRNAAPRRPHRERSQPGARSKWGLLEKHKDYSLRAADYNQKKKKLNVLSQKSREKNPDEFAFGMLASDRQKAGKHGRGDGDKNRLSVDEVKLLKGQDAGYLRTVLSRTRREVEKVREEIGLDGVLKRRDASVANEKKVTYDENGEPLRKKRRTSIDSFDSDEEMLDGNDEIQSGSEGDQDPPTYSSNIDFDEKENNPSTTTPIDPKYSSSDEEAKASTQPKSKKQLQKAAEAAARLKIQKRHRKRIREARAAKLDALKKRQKSIMTVAEALELQRAKMARTVGGVNKNGVKFKVRERKK